MIFCWTVKLPEAIKPVSEDCSEKKNLSLMIIFISRAALATAANQNQNATLEWTMQKIRFKAQCETANKDKQGQDSPGPGVTHSQGDMAHYSPFAVGRELKRRGRCGGWAGVGVRACAVRRGETAQSNWRKKGAISNQVPSAAQLATGQNTSVIRSLLTISPKSLRTTVLICNRLGNKGRVGGGGGLPGTVLVSHPTLYTNFLIRTSSGTAHCGGQARTCESGRVPDHQISTARHRVTSCLPSHILSSTPLKLAPSVSPSPRSPSCPCPLPPPCPLPNFAQR